MKKMKNKMKVIIMYTYLISYSHIVFILYFNVCGLSNKSILSPHIYNMHTFTRNV